MECVPKCAVCTGLCTATRVTGNGAVPATLAPRRSPAHRPTQFRLDCGCLTTPREQTLWSRLAPKGKPYWCDSCSKWCRKMKPPKPVTLPDVPPF